MRPSESEVRRMSRWLRRVGVVLLLMTPMPVVLLFQTEAVLGRGVISQVSAQVERGASPEAFVSGSAEGAGPHATGLAFWQESQDVNFGLGAVFLLSVLMSIVLAGCGGLCLWARQMYVPANQA